MVMIQKNTSNYLKNYWNGTN